MSDRTGSAGRRCRLRLEQLECRLAPAAPISEQMIGAPAVVADARVVEMGPMDLAAIRPLLAAVVAVGACAIWDRRSKRGNHAAHPMVKVS